MLLHSNLILVAGWATGFPPFVGISVHIMVMGSWYMHVGGSGGVVNIGTCCAAAESLGTEQTSFSSGVVETKLPIDSSWRNLSSTHATLPPPAPPWPAAPSQSTATPPSVLVRMAML